MLLLFARVNNLVLEWRALEDGTRSAEDAPLLRMEVRSQCSMIQHDLEDDSIWSGRWASSEREYFLITRSFAWLTLARVMAGLEFYRAALRVMIMCDVVGLPSSHPRVQRCIDALLNAIPRIRTGTEIGLVWPWLVSLPAISRPLVFLSRTHPRSSRAKRHQLDTTSCYRSSGGASGRGRHRRASLRLWRGMCGRRGRRGGRWIGARR